MSYICYNISTRSGRNTKTQAASPFDPSSEPHDHSLLIEVRRLHKQRRQRQLPQNLSISRAKMHRIGQTENRKNLRRQTNCPLRKLRRTSHQEKELCPQRGCERIRDRSGPVRQVHSVRPRPSGQLIETKIPTFIIKLLTMMNEKGLYPSQTMSDEANRSIRDLHSCKRTWSRTTIGSHRTDEQQRSRRHLCRNTPQSIHNLPLES